jgi:hypothetical protein
MKYGFPSFYTRRILRISLALHRTIINLTFVFFSGKAFDEGMARKKRGCKSKWFTETTKRLYPGVSATMKAKGMIFRIQTEATLF